MDALIRSSFLGLVAAMAWGLPSAHAQTFPSKPFRVLSTFTPGSVADGVMRVVAQKMSESVGQPVIVEAVAGAGGVLAAQTVVRAAPDGYTLLHCAPTTLVATPFILKNPPYDPLRDFTYITHMADATLSMVVANSPEEHLAQIKRDMQIMAKAILLGS